MNSTLLNSIYSLRARFRLYPVYIVVLTSLLLAGCGGPLTGYPQDRLPTQTAPASALAPQATNTPEGAFLPVVPLEPSPTVSPQPTQTPSPSPSPSPTTDPGITFAVIGDFGLAGPAEADVAALVQSWQPDLIITTGDNNYPDGAASTIDENIGQYFHNYIAPYTGIYGPGADTNRFFPSLGNHDWNTPGAQPYLDYFTLPGNERYYDFIWGPVHFFAVNSDSREPDGVGRSSVQAQWLQVTLAASTTPWQVVFMHHPPYSSGLHGPVDWMRWPFAEWGADLVLAGHDHVYERLEIDGIPHVINGLGGGPIYYFNTPLPESQVRYADDYGAMRVEASPERLQFQFISRTGQVIDDYALPVTP